MPPPNQVRPPGKPEGDTKDHASSEVSESLPLTADLAPVEQWQVMRPLRHDPLCGRCGGPSGPEGAWCDQCINECREYTRRLDNQAGGDQV